MHHPSFYQAVNAALKPKAAKLVAVYAALKPKAAKLVAAGELAALLAKGHTPPKKKSSPNNE